MSSKGICRKRSKETAQSSMSKTRTPLSPMIPQALPDLFNDTHSFAATPSASGFSRGAYMHSVAPNFQQIHVLQEQLSLYQAKLSETQLELCKTRTERDTIKASFGELIAVLRLPESTDPLNFSLTSSALTGHDKVLRPSRESHPKIRFWTRTDYDKYIENAESGSGTRGKAPWLELEDGGPVTVEQLRAIRKLLAKEELVEDDSDLVISESKCTVRNKNGKRQLSDDSESLAHQDGRKNFKSSPLQLTVIKELRDALPSPSLLLDQDSEPRSANGHSSSPINDSLPLEDHILNKLPRPRDASVPPFGVYLPQPSRQDSPPPRSPARETEFSPTRHTSMSHSAQGANKENDANIFGPRGIAKTIPAPAHSPIKKTDDGPAALKVPSDNKASKKKMRPGVAKNARNLCALRWLKQVKTSGTTDEFCMYWAALTPAQQDEYKADVERLQSAGTWTKASDRVVCEVLDSLVWVHQ
ncbi:hypothetical protein DEU56DRAFT_750442 [Suillus clintonianus]|uniref:uncharacterized protein n=1 Tax=Suillus clintonianus TaxID=1904413 RepID=UPI001B86F529|nr:uncharacterized protein DEU56DRAFT_750442 [Suillus clintonianus]KAG2157303.1 hypothetical protein DEU56DRAFT_750442 [Suillus clintonianus]